MASRYRVLLADDHTLVAEGLARLIELEFDLVAKVADGKQAVDAARKYAPDAVLLDISMPVLNGIEAARRILAENPKIKVIFITMHADATYIREALRAGASGYILKRSATFEIGAAIRSAMQGRVYITPLLAEAGEVAQIEAKLPDAGMRGELTGRQREVLQLVADGHSAKQIAAMLGISRKTAEFHKQVLMQKIGVHTAVELTKYALQHGIAGS